MSDRDSLSAEDVEPLHRHWRLLLIEGILLLALGTSAILLPFLAGVVLIILLGWLFLLAGAIGLATSWTTRKVSGFGWALTSSILAIIAGAILILWPIGGLVSLTFVLAAFLLIDGIVTIILALNYRSSNARNWGWMLLNGVMDLLLAGLIVVFLPGAATWIVGLVVGIDMVFGGISLITIGWSARPVAQVKLVNPTL